LLGKNCTKGILESALWYFKLRKKFNCGFGTLSLPWQDLTVTSRAAALSSVRLTEGHAPECNYKINDHQYTKRYYLVDDIYLKSSILVKTIPNPYCEKKSWFALCREGCKKDVKRADPMIDDHPYDQLRPSSPC
jgi:hypothetical protein